MIFKFEIYMLLFFNFNLGRSQKQHMKDKNNTVLKLLIENTTKYCLGFQTLLAFSVKILPSGK